jgi:hypothetical protein
MGESGSAGKLRQDAMAGRSKPRPYKLVARACLRSNSAFERFEDTRKGTTCGAHKLMFSNMGVVLLDSVYRNTIYF